MNAPVRIPHIPAPPFEPTSLLLNQRTGWPADGSAWDKVEAGPDGVLRLAEDSSSLRQLTEPSGSLGGLVPPRNVALDDDGTIYLLDREQQRLKRFDRCACRFDTVAHIGGEGGAAREWRSPGGIAIGCGKLYVCDSGREEVSAEECADPAAMSAKLRRENHRVSVFSLNGLALHDHLVLPDGKAWKPVAVALDNHGNAFVADPLNSMVHRFSPMLRFVKSFPGYANPTAVAIDCRGLLYVLCDGPANGRMLTVIDSEGQAHPAPKKVSDISQLFPALPFKVDAAGRLDLHNYCVGSTQTDQSCEEENLPPESLVFDAGGEPVVPEPVPVPVNYYTSGTVTFGPLDSKTRACIWHRIILHGMLPSGTRIEVNTFSSEEHIPLEQLADFARWETGQTAHAFDDDSWDCLIRSGAGRYLWLRLGFAGNGLATPAIEAIEIEFPRIGSRQYLPAVFSAEAGSADFTDRFLALFDTTLRGIERAIDTSPALFEPLSSPAQKVEKAPIDFLGWLASWMGLRFDRSWPEAKRRTFLKRYGSWLDRRGTLNGLRNALILLLGLDRGTACECPDQPVVRCGHRPANCAPPTPYPIKWQVPPLVLEHFRVRRWLYIGCGRLGGHSVLWGQRIVNRSLLDVNAQVGVTQQVARPDPLRDPFHSHAYQFTVFVPSCVRDNAARRKALENLLAAESPAHTRYYVEYVEPRFRIGVQSTLGFDAVVAAPPRTMTLGQQLLGHGVLGQAARERVGGAKLELGTRSRVGISTRIN